MDDGSAGLQAAWRARPNRRAWWHHQIYPGVHGCWWAVRWWKAEDGTGVWGIGFETGVMPLSVQSMASASGRDSREGLCSVRVRAYEAGASGGDFISCPTSALSFYHL